MRATFLESDEEFEGVGAHPDNHRYDAVDEEDPVLRQPVSPAKKFLAVQTRMRAFRVGVKAKQPRGIIAAPSVLVQRLDMHDGSHYQIDAGPANFDVLRSATESIAWKMSQSTNYVDPTFNHVRAEARRAKFLRALFYHWLSGTTDPEQQARNLLKALGTLGDNEGLMLDAEEGGINVDMALAVMEAVEAITHKPFVVYTGLYVAGGSIFKDPRIRMSKYGPRPMIVAAYVTPAKLLAAMKATGSLGLEIHAWQYSSNGPVPGITGRADMNAIFDPAMFNACCGSSTVHTDPKIPPVVTPPPVVVQPAPTPSPAQPNQENKLMFKIIEVMATDADGNPKLTGARFYAMEAANDGIIQSMRWSGPGDNPKVAQRDQWYNDHSVPVRQLGVGDLWGIELDGPLPAGDWFDWSLDYFANH